MARSFVPLFALLLAMFALGCGPTDRRAGETLGESEDELKSACAPPTTVLGIDIASYQHPGGAGIDWATVAANRRFVIIKASEGTGYTNSYYAGDSQGARAAGMIVGAYHWLHYTSSGAAQAKHFLASVGGNVAAGDLPAMLDVEEVNDSATAGQRVQIMKEWLDTVEAATGRKPMIYSGSWYWSGYLGSPGGYAGVYPMVWAAYVSGCPKVPDDFPGIVMWQYKGTGGVTPGIQGDCDQDMFYGSEAELLALANAKPAYRAEFVGQSFPPAAQPFQMLPGQELDAWIELKNTGTAAWDTNTHLGTTEPRDRESAFAGSDWLGPNRPSGVSGVVNPGESFKFHFTFHAPATPGSYDEHFGVVQEMLTWFSAPGQGGPADNFLEARIDVVQPAYAAKFVSQSFPLASEGAVELELGKTAQGTIELQNTGTESWKPGVTKLAPTPRDAPSPLATDAWLGDTRVSTVDHEVLPGESYAFPVELGADALGDYEQTFGLVQEAVTWFADAPAGGGPADDFLRVKLHVVAQPTTGTTPGKPSPSTPGGKQPTTHVVPTSDGSGCSIHPRPDAGSPAWLALLGFAWLGARRRRSIRRLLVAAELPRRAHSATRREREPRGRVDA